MQPIELFMAALAMLVAYSLMNYYDARFKSIEDGIHQLTQKQGQQEKRLDHNEDQHDARRKSIQDGIRQLTETQDQQEKRLDHNENQHDARFKSIEDGIRQLTQKQGQQVKRLDHNENQHNAIFKRIEGGIHQLIQKQGQQEKRLDHNENRHDARLRDFTAEIRQLTQTLNQYDNRLQNSDRNIIDNIRTIEQIKSTFEEMKKLIEKQQAKIVDFDQKYQEQTYRHNQRNEESGFWSSLFRVVSHLFDFFTGQKLLT